MLTYLYFGILIAAVVMAVGQIRQSLRKREPLGVDLPDAGAGIDLSLNTSSSSHHEAQAHGGCDAGGHDTGGFDCGSHGGFDSGGHH